MSPVAAAVLRAGLLLPEARAELEQWGDLPEVQAKPPELLEQVDLLLELALEEETVPRVTDLGLLEQFVSTRRDGKLRFEVNGQQVDVDVTFGMNRAGDILLPWRSEDIRDAVADHGQLTWSELEEQKTVTFRSAEDLYFGELKVFMRCTPHAQGWRST